ncbi:trypsin-like peptidase domain-containing protein [Defluviimonas sp. WL0002]|uniref:Trypsin-like peptidase domain-containing protein n=1 Tax=Albidovulum marisflavi TaxID=2984159 RepID=A0ABT2ZAH0_9RHOB|nr:trypsin-like peptidase domain-containing protein [Defluviimonas sp. WL0002]MCV2868140.1 trypsin-like peptidase domain-containing protein [Defluviimonas sp. WL0002]
MLRALCFVVLITSLLGARVALAQESWVQIEAHSTLQEAQERARAYGGAFPNVVGYSMSTGWYAVALGPYTAEEAGYALTRLKSDRLIPDDSYVTDGSRFRQRFWPVGTLGATEAPAAIEPEPVVTAPAEAPEETQAEAYASEALLTQEERRLLQTALQWAGHYTSAIDGAIGPGTRRSMAEWQAEAGYPVTGVLTTSQRNALIGAYQAELALFGFTRVQEDEAGIEIDLPLGLVAFDRYDAPFARFSEKDGSGFQVLLISRPGDQNSLFALYELMQTLTIVPLDGPRDIQRNSFTISGANSTVASYTQASVDGGLIKGFTLVWNASDAERADRVLRTMQASFRPFGTHALDDSLGQPLAEPRENLIAGIEVRRPVLSRSGFYVDGAGTVLTTVEAVKQCGRVTLDGTHEADVVYRSADSGIAILKPRESLAPMSHAAFRAVPPRRNAEVAVAGYSYGDALTQPVMTFGTLADVQGLDGETEVARLSLRALPGDAGGPVFDMSGSVVGMLLPREDKNGRVLPEDVGYALEADVIATALGEQGLSAMPTDRSGAMAPEDLTRIAQGMTVLVSCWN